MAWVGADLRFLMPPPSVEVDGQRPWALKWVTAQPAACWRAAFLEPNWESSELKGAGWPSISMRQAQRLPIW